MAFHVFSYIQFYPSGGAGDYNGSRETLEEAKTLAEQAGGEFADILIERDGKLVRVSEGWREGFKAPWQWRDKEEHFVPYEHDKSYGIWK